MFLVFQYFAKLNSPDFKIRTQDILALKTKDLTTALTAFPSKLEPEDKWSTVQGAASPFADGHTQQQGRRRRAHRPRVQSRGIRHVYPAEPAVAAPWAGMRPRFHSEPAKPRCPRGLTSMKGAPPAQCARVAVGGVERAGRARLAAAPPLIGPEAPSALRFPGQWREGGGAWTRPRLFTASDWLLCLRVRFWKALRALT